MSSAPDTEVGIREIDTGAPPTRFARGWHCLGLKSEYDDGEPPHSVQVFGTKLVVWVDTKGELNILDAFCRHMGGDLSQGKLSGDNVACPFHGWLWKGNGRCAGVPYAKRNPPKLAKTRSWPSMVRNGQVFVYNDPPEGNPPPDEVIIPSWPSSAPRSGPTGRGTGSSSRAPTVARSSTTSSTWRTSTTCISLCRTISRMSSRARSPPST